MLGLVKQEGFGGSAEGFLSEMAFNGAQLKMNVSSISRYMLCSFAGINSGGEAFGIVHFETDFI